MRLSSIAFVVLIFSGSAGAQKAPPRLFLAPDLRIEAKSVARINGSLLRLNVGPDGRMIVTLKNVPSPIGGFDSTGKALPWRIPVSFSDDSEIGWADRLGWTGSTLWVDDRPFKQVALIDPQGKVTASLPNPTWVHPRWADRRKFPFFGYLRTFAVYADSSRLVFPMGRRSLLDTPEFSRSHAHLLRIDADGTIRGIVARFQEQNGMLTVGNEARSAHTMPIPFAGRSYWSVSEDGGRVTIVAPGRTLQDSGSFRVTTIGEKGDTVYSRRYPMPAVRVKQSELDSALAAVRGFGDATARQIRDTLVKLIPAYRSYVTGTFTGRDHSTWVLMRPVADTAKARDALVLDERGEPLGIVRIPDGLTPLAVDRTRLWGAEKGALVRLKLKATPVAATPAPLPRSARASTGRD